ncbi:MAG TPA: DUF2071 domain-containing protein [Phycisphaerales bacterium]|nr:DUF2071 domain-containing protein [Phycisphaerales bacterium]
MIVAPSRESRREVCRRPAQFQVMHQNWNHLLFLHWEMDPDLLRSTLPEGLHLDTFEGKAYLGVVPFFMNNIRPRFCPTVPGISDFLEMNLRTYVHDDHGKPGVWFYCLEANQALAVGVARRLFHLPYQHAVMQARVDKEGWVHYKSRRAWTGVSSEYLYRPAEPAKVSEEGTLEYFLAERYVLFSEIAGKIYSGRVYHTPYLLSRAEVARQDARLFMLNGFHPPERPADLAHYSRGVKVDVYPLTRN